MCAPLIILLYSTCDNNIQEKYQWYEILTVVLGVPYSKVRGINMGPIWGWQDPDGTHVGPMNFAIWGSSLLRLEQWLSASFANALELLQLYCKLLKSYFTSACFRHYDATKWGVMYNLQYITNAQNCHQQLFVPDFLESYVVKVLMCCEAIYPRKPVAQGLTLWCSWWLGKWQL